MRWFLLFCTTSAVICTVAALPAFNMKEKQSTMQPPRIVNQTAAKKVNEQIPKLLKTSNTKGTNIFPKTDDSVEDFKNPPQLLPAPPALLPRNEKQKKTDQKNDPEFIFRTVGDHIANIKVGPVFPDGVRPEDFHYNIPTAPIFIPEQDRKEDDIYKYEQFINDTAINKYESSAKSTIISQIAISPPPNTPLYFLPVDDLKNQAKYNILRNAVLKVLKVPGTIVGVIVLPTPDYGNTSVSK